MRYILAVVTAAITACTSLAQSTQRPGVPAQRGGISDSAFASLVAQLSEEGGHFDTDNLISNESSYLHVTGTMRRLGLQGGAYIGVGPDQNFSYIAQLRPRIAFIVDIRRDNLLQQLLFKSLFSMSRNRIEYLCLLFGREPPANSRDWEARNLTRLAEHVDSAPFRPDLAERTRVEVLTRARKLGIPLSPTDTLTIGRFHSEFATNGLDIRFTSMNRRPRPYYPTYRQLMLETDLAGRQASYLATEESFRFVQSLQRRNLVVPVVGDLAGEHALRAIGQEIARRGERVSAFYTSNVEFYLMRGGTFARFAETVASLPRDKSSVLIRSYFGGVYGTPHAQAVPGYFSTQLLQKLESFVGESARGGYETYFDVVSKHAIEP
ncbi:MAG: hypothetical protein M3466_18570 [Gemmatimonadota bacterium]|nr:hypothetical protein [Gemmatimonadota bacterium]